jgi:hypothetical protein
MFKLEVKMNYNKKMKIEQRFHDTLLLLKVEGGFWKTNFCIELDTIIVDQNIKGVMRYFWAALNSSGNFRKTAFINNTFELRLKAVFFDGNAFNCKMLTAMGEIAIYLAKFSEGIRRKAVKRTGAAMLMRFKCRLYLCNKTENFMIAKCSE